MTTQIDHAREAIAKINNEFMSAFERGDAARVAGLYTQGARLLPPGMGIVTGKASIEAFWKGAMTSGIKRVQLKSLDLEQHGDLAVEVGTALLYGAAGEIIDKPKYLVVWKLEDNQWRLHCDMWNGDASAPAQ
jgi:uncharacterized protein (TIGR02246 family)